MDNSTDQEKIAEFVSFHGHPHASFYNTIDCILTDSSIEDSLREFLDIIGKGCLFVEYPQDSTDEIFLNRLAGILSEGSFVFIRIKGKISSVVFDQFSSIKQSNKFTINFMDETLNDTKININTKIFLISDSNPDYVEQAVELADHVLDLRKEKND